MGITQDIRFAVRTLAKRPGFTAVAVITMALGIGANAAIFSVISGVLLKSLPYRDAGQIMFVLEKNEGRFKGLLPMSSLNYRDLKEQSHSFEFMGARRPQAASLMSGERPERILGEQVTSDYFRVLGVNPLAGREFAPEEQQAGGAPVALISNGLWKRRFGMDPNILGQTIRMDGKSVTIVGVMPNDYRPGIEFWTPLIINYEGADRDFHDTTVVGRLAAGVGQAQAQGEMTGLSARLAEQYPQINTGAQAMVISMHDQIVTNIRPTLLILLATVAMVLLIACSNVANLLLTRVAGREKELAIRMALGSGRSRLARYILTESLVLSFVGGTAGVLVAAWGTGPLVGLNSKGIPLAKEISIDWTVLSFALGISILSGILFGAFPALQVVRSNLFDALKEGGRSLIGNRHSRKLRGGLVVLEIAFSLVLLVAAGLSLKSFRNLIRVETGFATENLMSFQMFLPAAEYPNPASQLAFQKEVIRKLGELPGARSAAATSVVPLSGPGARYIFWADGHALPAPHEAPLASYRIVSPGYFHTMGIPLIKGREFADSDEGKSLQVGIVNKEFAERMWPGEDPIGKRFTVGVPLEVKGDVPWTTIVGVVGGVRQTTLDAEPGMEMYQPLGQSPFPNMSFIVKTELDPRTFFEPARAMISSMNSDLPVSNLKAMDDILHDASAPSRFNMLLLGLFGLLALVLSAVGVYGVISYSVSQRSQEIGIRMALGASRREVGKLVVGEGAILTLAGVALGVGGSILFTRLMSYLLVGVVGFDGFTTALVAIMLALVSILACYIPARRAMRVDPIVALRWE